MASGRRGGGREGGYDHACRDDDQGGCSLCGHEDGSSDRA